MLPRTTSPAARVPCRCPSPLPVRLPTPTAPAVLPLPPCPQAVDKVVRWGELESEEEESDEEEEEEEEVRGSAESRGARRRLAAGRGEACSLDRPR